MSFNSLLGETGRNSSISSNPTPTKKRIRLSKSVVHDHSPRQEVSIYISEKVKSCTVPSQVKLQVKSKVPGKNSCVLHWLSDLSISISIIQRWRRRWWRPAGRRRKQPGSSVTDVPSGSRGWLPVWPAWPVTQVGTPENTLNGPRYDIFSLLDFIEQPAGEIERPSDAPAEDLLSWGTSHLRGRAVKPRREERALPGWWQRPGSG